MIEIYYIYVEKSCTVKGKKAEIPSINLPYDEATIVPVTVQDFTLHLKQGWNRATKTLSATATSGMIIIGDTDSGDLKTCDWVVE